MPRSYYSRRRRSRRSKKLFRLPSPLEPAVKLTDVRSFDWYTFNEGQQIGLLGAPNTTYQSAYTYGANDAYDPVHGPPTGGSVNDWSRWAAMYHQYCVLASRCEIEWVLPSNSIYRGLVTWGAAAESGLPNYPPIVVGSYLVNTRYASTALPASLEQARQTEGVKWEVMRTGTSYHRHVRDWNIHHHALIKDPWDTPDYVAATNNSPAELWDFRPFYGWLGQPPSATMLATTGMTSTNDYTKNANPIQMRVRMFYVIQFMQPK